MSAHFFPSDLRKLRGLMRTYGDVRVVAGKLGRSPEDCDRALWDLVGRTAEHAAAARSGKGKRDRMRRAA